MQLVFFFHTSFQKTATATNSNKEKLQLRFLKNRLQSGCKTSFFRLLQLDFETLGESETGTGAILAGGGAFFDDLLLIVATWRSLSWLYLESVSRIGRWGFEALMRFWQRLKPFKQNLSESKDKCELTFHGLGSFEDRFKARVLEVSGSDLLKHWRVPHKLDGCLVVFQSPVAAVRKNWSYNRTATGFF